MKKYGIVVLAVAALDQLIKAFVRMLPTGEVFFEIPGLFSLVNCLNTGAAFSLLSGHTLLLLVISMALLALIWGYATRKMKLSVMGRIAVSCLVGGGMGNLLDRMLYFGVTDYILLRFVDFPVFNLADVVITASVALLFVLLLSDRLEEPLEDHHGSDD